MRRNPQYIQYQAWLTPDQHRELKQAARKTGLKMSQLVRTAIDMLLRAHYQVEDETDRAMSAVDSGQSIEVLEP